MRISTRHIPIVAVLLVFGFVSTSCIRPARFEGTSMRPAINDGDRILLNANFGDLKRGDVVSFKYPKDESKLYVKRIIGLPNETIEIQSGTVLINSQILDEPYVNPSNNQNIRENLTEVIPSDEYFVMGDNRDNSSDSRIWGTVRRELIQGKYYMTYFSTE